MPRNEEKRSSALPMHRHCVNCGLPVKEDEEFCSDKCKAEFQKLSRKNRISLLLPIAFLTIVIVILVLVSYFKK